MTMMSASTSVTATSWIEAFTKVGRVVHDAALQAPRQLRLDVGDTRRARP